MKGTTSIHVENSQNSPRRYTSKFTACITIILCTVFFVQAQAQATEVILIGGGSDAHDSHIRFEDSVRWKRRVLSEQGVNSTTLFNDGNLPTPDISFAVDNSSNEQSATALSHVFDNAHSHKIRYRDHLLNNVNASSSIADLESTITAKLANASATELLIIHTGRGGYTDGTEDNAFMKLWNDDRLEVNQLHDWMQGSDRPVRFVFSQSHSGGFHRLAYKNASRGLELTSQTYCGFTSTSAYQKAETDITSLSDSDYRDYGSYFFSAIAGYEYDGEIISRFSDLNEDGHVTLREAHLFSLLEGRSIDLPLSTSEDYLLRWQPWYLRWQPAQNTPPNNEYTRIFRDLASQLDVPLTNSIVLEIRARTRRLTLELKELEHLYKVQTTGIALLQEKLQSKAFAQWPQLRAPYAGGFEALVSSGRLPEINTFLESKQPDYSQLVTLMNNAVATQTAKLQNNRAMSQYAKLIRLRHLALLKGQLFAHGSTEQINAYKSLVDCEDVPLQATVTTATASEDL